jgi:putative hydrolase of the HAD superfamily
VIDALICDMDDTLLPCGIFYKDRREKLIDYHVGRTGLPAALVNKVFDGIDLGSTELANGFSKERYPRSFEACSVALDVILGHPITNLARKKSYEIGRSVFDAPYYLFDQVWETLERFKKAGVKLYLITKGDEEVQQKKIKKNHLDFMFPLTHIHIVPKKGIAQLHEIGTLHKMDYGRTVYVGDSLKDDIYPATELGMQPVLIRHPDVPLWSYDHEKSVNPIRIEYFHEVLNHYPV